jgi:aryl-alcohol dehydrogenase-like predicted oxidoreductase
MTPSTAWQRVATLRSRGIELLPRSVLTLGLVSGEKAMHEQSPKGDQHDQDSSL